MTRAVLVIGTVLAAAALAGTAVWRPGPVLLWNVTPSAPVGLYRLWRAPARLGDWVAAAPPAGLVRMFAARRYLPAGAPLVKRVAAVAPALVCRRGARILLGERLLAVARSADQRGRPLPVWRGCRSLHRGEVFLLNPARDSLDGRYFGPTPQRDILGRLTPLWIVSRAVP